jgi:hypothetical protein
MKGARFTLHEAFRLGPKARHAIQRELGLDFGSSVSACNVESTSCHESLATQKVQRLCTQCRIHVHSRRKRKADSDGVSCKAVIDGLERAGILQADSPEYVSYTTQSQAKCKKGETEETVVQLFTQKQA